MIQDNAVRQVDNCCVSTDTNTVCRITNLFFSLFHRLCYENNSRNINLKVIEKYIINYFVVVDPK